MKARLTMICALAMLALPLHADEIKVALASNFKETFTPIAQSFEVETGHKVLITAAATGVIYNQISHGAPFDLFLSADSVTAQKLAAQGRGGQPFTYAIGKLALWQRGGPMPDEAVLRQWRGNLAIANARLAPYGAAAMAVLARLTIAPQQYRLLTGANIGQVWQFVQTGHAPLGFVAWSNVVAAGKTTEAWLIPTDFYPPIEQQGIVLTPTPAVQALVSWLTQQGRESILQAGYGLPSKN